MLLIHTAILLLSSVLSVTAECTTGNSSCGIYTNPSACPKIKADACNDSEIVTPCEEMGPPPEGKVCCQDLCKRGGFYDVLLIDTACFTVKCSAGYVCVRGRCVKRPYDPCMFMRCARGYICIQGRCVRSCPSVIKARPIVCNITLRSILPRTCDFTNCQVGEECCLDDCSYPICVKIPDPIFTEISV